MTFGTEGANFKVTEALPERVLESIARWAAPVTLSVEIKTSATPGIASALFFGSLDGGDEIDLELCTSGTTPEMQFPIWRPGNAGKARKLSISWDKSKELAETLDPSMHRSKALVPDYGYTMDGYDPTSWTAYDIQWTPGMIAWKIGGKDRVRFTKNSAMPLGPQPIRWGPWDSGKNAAWCGKRDWQKSPSASMAMRKLIVEGCRVME